MITVWVRRTIICAMCILFDRDVMDTMTRSDSVAMREISVPVAGSSESRSQELTGHTGQMVFNGQNISKTYNF